MPKGPNNYNPFKRHDDAVARRNYVIDRMIEDGFVSSADGERAKKEPLEVTLRPPDTHVFAAEYFAEDVRRYLLENYGQKKLYEGGLVGAHHARSQAAGPGAQDHDQWAHWF